MSDIKNSIIIYCKRINIIGGIETWLYYMVENFYDKYDITILYRDAYINQILRLSEYVKIEELNESKDYECTTLLLASNWDDVPKNIKYNKCVQTVHSNYDYLKEKLGYTFQIPQESNQVISVSNQTHDALLKTNGVESKVIYNILGKKKDVKPVIHLITLSRLTVEKGFKRICKLIDILKSNNVKFDWKIFTDDKQCKEIDKIKYPEIMIMQPTLDTIDYLADATYLVQLSDSEAFSYSIHEALQYGTPVLVTNMESVTEFVKDGYNGYVFDMDMSNIDIDKIVNHIPKDFKYNQPCDVNEWIKIFGEPSTQANDNVDEFNNEIVTLKVLVGFYDKIDKVQRYVGDIFECDKLRSYELSSTHNNANIQLCTRIKVG